MVSLKTVKNTNVYPSESFPVYGIKLLTVKENTTWLKEENLADSILASALITVAPKESFADGTICKIKPQNVAMQE